MNDLVPSFGSTIQLARVPGLDAIPHHDLVVRESLFDAPPQFALDWRSGHRPGVRRACTISMPAWRSSRPQSARRMGRGSRQFQTRYSASRHMHAI